MVQQITNQVENQNQLKDEIEEIQSKIEYMTEDQKRKWLKNPLLTSEQRSEVILSINKRLRNANDWENQIKIEELLGYPDVPVELLKQYTFCNCWRIKKIVARNVRTPVLFLSNLASDEDVDVRKAVAGNISSTDPILSYLSRDIEEDVIIEVAKNPSTSNEVLKRLISTRKINIIKAIYKNPKITPTLFNELKQEVLNSLKEMSIQCLRLSKETEDCFFGAGKRTINDLITMSTRDIVKIRKINSHTVIDKIHQLGFKFTDEQ